MSLESGFRTFPIDVIYRYIKKEFWNGEGATK